MSVIDWVLLGSAAFSLVVSLYQEYRPGRSKGSLVNRLNVELRGARFALAIASAVFLAVGLWMALQSRSWTWAIAGLCYFGTSAINLRSRVSVWENGISICGEWIPWQQVERVDCYDEGDSRIVAISARKESGEVKQTWVYDLAATQKDIRQCLPQSVLSI